MGIIKLTEEQKELLASGKEITLLEAFPGVSIVIEKFNEDTIEYHYKEEEDEFKISGIRTT